MQEQMESLRRETDMQLIREKENGQHALKMSEAEHNKKLKARDEVCERGVADFRLRASDLELPQSSSLVSFLAPVNSACFPLPLDLIQWRSE
jgi:hypothetical protein